MNTRIHIVLAGSVSPQDVERALIHTGLVLRATLSPSIYTIDRAPRPIDELSIHDAAISMFHRRQAD